VVRSLWPFTVPIPEATPKPQLEEAAGEKITHLQSGSIRVRCPAQGDDLPKPGNCCTRPSLASRERFKQEGRSSAAPGDKNCSPMGSDCWAFVLVASWQGRNCGCCGFLVSRSMPQRQPKSLCHHFCSTEYFCGFHSPRVDVLARWAFRKTTSVCPQRENFCASCSSPPSRLILATDLQRLDFPYLNRCSPSSVAPCATWNLRWLMATYSSRPRAVRLTLGDRPSRSGKSRWRASRTQPAVCPFCTCHRNPFYPGSGLQQSPGPSARPQRPASWAQPLGCEGPWLQGA